MNKKYFNYAEKLTSLSSYKRIKIGCILVYKGKVFSSGFNNMKTHPIQKIYNTYRFKEDTPSYLHAEIHALLPYLKQDIKSTIDWKNVKLITYRKKKDSHDNYILGNSRPCKSCMALIKDLGIKDIYYTTENGYCYEKIENN